MNNKLIAFNLEQRKKDMPDLKAGDIVKVYRKIQEAGKERVQIFEGMVIATRGGQSSSPTITVRKVSYGVGVELVIPIYSPSVEKIDLVKRAKVRSAKLYYVREKTAKSLRFKYSEVKPKEEVKEEVVEPEAVLETQPKNEVEEKPTEKTPVEEPNVEVGTKTEEVREEAEVKPEEAKKVEEKK